MLTLIVTIGAQVVYFGGEELTLLPLEQVAEPELPEILLWLDRDKCSEGYGAFFWREICTGSEDGRVSNRRICRSPGQPHMDKSEAVITASFIRLKPWDMVTHVLTYPRQWLE